ncbi:MAG: Phospho-2-dehydro-3-deoxyheptonate aldolase [Phycisphaerae bacterium]|nr:Phospho-2-dehydro-3-deoxyheptonate aldolase [Phycisphaerae bacterium]
MIVVMRPLCTEEQIDHVVARIRSLGLTPHLSRGEFRTIIGAIGGATPEAVDQLDQLPGVDHVLRIAAPFKLASREFHEADTVIDVRGLRIGGPHVHVIAGPCTIESEAMLYEVGRAVRDAGATILRGGAFKPRTSPYAFTGLGDEGLRLLKEAGAALSMPTITEVMDVRDVEKVAEGADILQIGARNMQNFNLLTEVGRLRKPVFLKRGFSATVTELLMSAEYILSQGNHQVILCERGIRAFCEDVRFTLDISAVPLIQEKSHLPVFVDPSHAAGKRDLVPALALAAVAAGAAGVMIEVHAHPEAALCDGPQAVLPNRFTELLAQLRDVARAVGKQPATPTTR